MYKRGPPLKQAEMGVTNRVIIFSHQKRRHNFIKNYEHLHITKCLVYASTFKFYALSVFLGNKLH